MRTAIIIAIIIVVLIVLIVGIVLVSSSAGTPAIKPIETTTNTGTEPAYDVPVPESNVLVSPATPAVVFQTAASRSLWDPNAAGKYTCPKAAGVNLTGNNGDYARYCIFNNLTDANKHCSEDPTCIAYIDNGRNIQATNSMPIEKAGMQTTTHIRSSAMPAVVAPATPAPQVTYQTAQSKSLWDRNGGGVYTCPNAQGVNLAGNGGAFAQYCIFDNVMDANRFCTMDPNCVAFIDNGRNVQATNAQPVERGGVSTTTYIKTR